MPKKTVARVLASALACLLVSPLAAADWRIGVARVKITPGKPLVLSGYASRLKPFNRVEHDLWAKALAFEDERGQRAVLVTTDLAGISAAIAADIFTRITRATGLPRERILLSWSHTHSGPRLSLSTAPYPGVTALYMTGCSGVANPHPRGTMELARKHGETLAREVGRVLAGKLAPLSGPLTTVLGAARS